jgi:LmbE family N-acetylglucosaminyl deacetylase
VSVVLAIGAHTDDAELGAGGTLAKHVLAGDSVTILHLSVGVGARTSSAADRTARTDAAVSALAALGSTHMLSLDLDDQLFDKLALLDITQRIESACHGLQPDVIYTHHEGDLNLDHSITARAVKTAFRPKPGVKVPRILAFEVLSTTELGQPFVPTVYVDVTGEPMRRKVKALQAYGAEIPPEPHPRSVMAVRYKAFSRGAEVGLHEAEAFHLLREVI